MSTVARLYLVFFALTFFGCGSDLSMEPLVADVCEADTQCPGSQICRYGFCTVPDAPTRVVGFRLIPPNSSMLQPQLVQPAEIETDEPVTLGMRSSVRAAGRLLFSDLGGISAEGPTGTLSFRRDDPLVTGFVQQQRVEADSRYSVLLLPGRYDVTFTPDDPDRPGRVWEDLQFELDTDPQLTVPTRIEVVSARIVDQISAAMLEPRGLEDATIVAISKVSGAKSTVASSDETGLVQLSVYPQSGVYDIQITTEDGDVVREVVLESVLDCTERCKSTLQEGDLLDFNLAGVAGDRVSRSIVLGANAESQPDFAGVTVDVEGQFEWGRWRVRKPLDSGGRLDLFGPEGTYDVRVSTPADFPLASTIQSLSIEAGDAPLRVVLTDKTLFATTVKDFDGKPLATARVEFQSADGPTEIIVAESDTAGRVSTFLEKIGYWMTIIPSSPAKPRGVRYIADDAILPLADRGISLPEPAVLTGSVLGAADNGDAWESVPEVTVQAFEVIQGRAITIGEATTQDDGQFRMVIPADQSR